MLDQENPYLDFSEHAIHKVVLLTLNPFWLDLVENGVNINIQPFYDRTILDYKTMSVSLCHIFDNITSFCKNYHSLCQTQFLKFHLLRNEVAALLVKLAFLRFCAVVLSLKTDGQRGLCFRFLFSFVLLRCGRCHFVSHHREHVMAKNGTANAAAKILKTLEMASCQAKHAF